MRFLGALLIIIGILGIIVGVVYFVEPAHSLPSWFPGHLASAAKTLHHDKRGIIGVAVGAVLLIIGGLLAARPSGAGRRAYRY